ncbi:YhaI family protein [Metabacillus malikii]|uniref:DUF1878 family protein n=1 Tax=Metabacillus malikii TaxID=1504265 RepID=A0ABT9ZKK3_9BACI|nr:YhaI family protein [Metabacillus malikii]MDQ0232311.1 hypothetical protein [Metabacillus malikii]
MESLETRLATLEYYQQLLLEMIDSDKCPFYRLVMERGLTKSEVEGVYRLCDELNEEYEQQKAQGLVIYTDLLTQFAGLLNEKLNVNETVYAMIKQGIYEPLMNEFKHLISD